MPPPAGPAILGGMDGQREDYADPPNGPSIPMGLAWLAALFLTLAGMAFAILLACGLTFRY